MMEIAEFIQASRGKTVVDVRSPAEFSQGHIPGAINIPLFDNDERAEIGTLYKQEGRDHAVMRGIEIAGPKFASIIREVKQHCDSECYVHCWRGGMRSNSVAWLLQQADIKCHVLDGGYKSFRNHVLVFFENRFQLTVLSGLTGAGKTELLPIISELGEQVVDLEGLASHRGSAFGGIGLVEQPSIEHFENMLFDKLSQLDPERPIWVEDESRNVGRCCIPAGLFHQMRASRVIFLDVPVSRRAELIMRVYGDMPTEELSAAIERVRKRLGGIRTQQALAAVDAGDIQLAIEILLDYYDKGYQKSASSRDDSRTLKVPVGIDEDIHSIASRLIDCANTGRELSADFISQT